MQPIFRTSLCLNLGTFHFYLGVSSSTIVASLVLRTKNERTFKVELSLLH